MTTHTESALTKIPVEDLLDLYFDTMNKFVELKQKPYTMEEKEKLKDELKTKIKQLYKSVGVDFEEEVLKINKQLKENNIII